MITAPLAVIGFLLYGVQLPAMLLRRLTVAQLMTMACSCLACLGSAVVDDSQRSEEPTCRWFTSSTTGVPAMGW